MSHVVHLPVSDELKNAFSRAKGQSSVRFLKIKIVDEKLELDSTGTAGSDSDATQDFEGLGKQLQLNEAAYIAFRYKTLFETAPWALLAYIPDTTDVKTRMIYASSFVGTGNALGMSTFGKLVKYTTPEEFVWKDFESAASHTDEEPVNNSGSDSPATIPLKSSAASKIGKDDGDLDTSIPYNQRELAIHQLEKDERKARKELEEISTTKPTQASGFHQVSFPLTPEAEEDIKQLAAGQHNWVQLSLDDKFTTIGSKERKNITPSELSQSVLVTEPQFYLYNRSGTVVLIYCCPDKGSTIKNRMVYSTCKASLADQIKNLGIEHIKKYDVRDAAEVTDSALTQHLKTNVSNMFEPSAAMMRGGPMSNSVPTKTNFNNKPVFNSQGSTSSKGGVGAVPIMAATGNRNAPQGGIASLMKESGGGSKQLPKGVVLPPKGAYC